VQNTAQRCAEQLIGIVPKLMQTMREEMRAGRASELTVPQFRTLVFFQLHKGAALSQASEHLGLALPSTSKLVEHLVLRGLLTRAACAADRRKVAIALTAEGRDVLAVATRAAADAFARKLCSLSATELDVLSAMLGSLESVLGAESNGQTAPGQTAPGQATPNRTTPSRTDTP